MADKPIIVNDRLMICSDCMSVVTNATMDQLDSYPARTKARRSADIVAGLKRINRMGRIERGNRGEDVPWSTTPCMCCGLPLRGPRFHCRIIKKH